MSAFNFIETKATSLPLNSKKLDFNESLINQNCYELCLFRNLCNPQVMTANNTVEVSGNEGVIGKNNSKSRCVLTKYELRDDGFFGVNLK